MKIVIVGGVAGGASTAARARRLDEHAEIVILERGKHVSYANCGLPYHIGGVIPDRDSLFLQTPESLKATLALDVRTGHEATRILREARKVSVRKVDTGETYEESYDKLVLCPGASPIRPPLPGIEHPRVFVLRNVDDMDAILGALKAGARNAIVIGAGYIGLELAENLRARGLEVVLVEMTGQLLPPLDAEMTRDLERHVQSHGVQILLNTAAAAFHDAGGRLSVALSDGKSITVDLAVMAVGVKPDVGLARDAGLAIGRRGIKVDTHMRTSDPDIYAAGDVVDVMDTILGETMFYPLAGPANRQGRVAADHIFGRDTVYTSTQGTAIVKVFDMTAGSTGVSEKVLKQMNRPYRKIYIHPSAHAGYYPGSTPLHLKLLFAPDGKVLGAQVIGFDGVDKRLDVLATAIRAGMTVFDLESLELAYAPPYGSAKDPVNMAGFVAANLLRGDVAFWYAEDYPALTKAGTIVDVRSKHEYDAWHIPGAVNLPIGKLRATLGAIPKDRPVFLYCRVGFRSYLAYRVLKQRGFDQVSTLAGGSLTFSNYHETELSPDKPSVPFLAYAEEKMIAPATTGKTTRLDCCALQCPGPILRLKDFVETMAVGDEVVVCATEAGFEADCPAWCQANGHQVLDIQHKGARTEVRIRKGTLGTAPAAVTSSRPKEDRMAIIVFSGDMDKVLAAFVIANGAIAMGSQVTMFFTFWGLNVLRRTAPPPSKKPLLDRMFGWMMPRGPDALTLSKLNMMGAGTAMMKHAMKQKGVDSLPSLMEAARKGGVKLVACTMSMEVMGIKAQELIDGVGQGGVASFLAEADQAKATLFI